MPRARNIKPSFFTNELLGTADIGVQLLFAGLWCLADRTGVLEDRPLRIQAEIFPYRSQLDVNGYLTVLERMGFVVRYEVDGVGYIKVLNFEKHQSPHHTERAKNFPQPPSIQPKCSLTPLRNGDLTVLSRSDSLIPDSLIPDSKNKVEREKVEVPEWVPGDAWKAWLEVRPKVKAPNTPRALTLAIRELEKLRADGHDPRAVLEQSTVRGYRGLFPVDRKGHQEAAGSIFGASGI